MSVVGEVDQGVAERGLVAADVMKAAPRSCSPFSTVVEALLIFKDGDCDLVPVVNEGKSVGIVTDRDVALALVNKPDLAARPVSEVMTQIPAGVSATADLAQVASLLAETGSRRLLVLDSQGNLIGLIGWSEIGKHLKFEPTLPQTNGETAGSI